MNFIFFLNVSHAIKLERNILKCIIVVDQNMLKLKELMQTTIKRILLNLAVFSEKKKPLR